MAMTTTEKIISFAVPQALGKLLGPKIKLVGQMHKVHFVFLGRAVQEASRDQEIQKSIKKMLEAVQKMNKSARDVLKEIPENPKPPEMKIEKGALADNIKKVEAYTKGVQNVIKELEEQRKKLDEVTKKTDKEFKKIEKVVNSKKGTKVSGMRALSKHYRTLELFELSQQLNKLESTLTDTENRIKRYKNH